MRRTPADARRAPPDARHSRRPQAAHRHGQSRSGVSAPHRLRGGGMSAAMTLATARRVLIQLRHDPRTVVLIMVVPSMLMVLLRYVFDSARFFSGIAPALLGFFPFLMMFLIASITTLRERTSGTLERLM